MWFIYVKVYVFHLINHDFLESLHVVNNIFLTTKFWKYHIYALLPIRAIDILPTVSISSKQYI